MLIKVLRSFYGYAVGIYEFEITHYGGGIGLFVECDYEVRDRLGLIACTYSYVDAYYIAEDICDEYDDLVYLSSLYD